MLLYFAGAGMEARAWHSATKSHPQPCFVFKIFFVVVCFSEHALKVKKSGLEPCARDLVRM